MIRKPNGARTLGISLEEKVLQQTGGQMNKQYEKGSTNIGRQSGYKENISSNRQGI